MVNPCTEIIAITKDEILLHATMCTHHSNIKLSKKVRHKRSTYSMIPFLPDSGDGREHEGFWCADNASFLNLDGGFTGMSTL